MKKYVFSLLIIIIGLIVLPSTVNAQDVIKSEKKIMIKTVTKENGERVVKDTIIVGNDEYDIIGNIPNQKSKLIVITDSDIDSKDDSNIETDKNVFVFDNTETYDIIDAPNTLKKPFQFNNEYSHKVTDIELRDAGINNKPNRLNVENMNIDIKNGVVDIEFTTEIKKTPKIFIYNVYGDKIFKGKPELIHGSYQIKIDLSDKQYGTYYLQLISGNTSLTKRLKL